MEKNLFWGWLSVGLLLLLLLLRFFGGGLGGGGYYYSLPSKHVKAFLTTTPRKHQISYFDSSKMPNNFLKSEGAFLRYEITVKNYLEL